MEQRSASLVIPDIHGSHMAVEQRSATLLIPERRDLCVGDVARWKPVWKQRLVVGALIALDALLAMFISGVASVLQGLWGQGVLSTTAIAAMAPIIAVWVGLRALLGLYPGYGLDSVEQLRRHTYTVFATLAILAIFALGFQIGDSLSRLLLGFIFLGLLVLVPFAQYAAKWWMKQIGIWGKPVVILGYKATGANVVDVLRRGWELGYDPIAVFDYRLDMSGGSIGGMEAQQSLDGAVDLARRRGVDTAIFAMPYTRREQLADLVGLASLSFRHVLVIPNLNGITNSAVVARDLAGIFAVEIKYNLLDPWARRIKRALDLTGAVAGGLLISPLLLATIILIKLDSSGPAFYGHRRLGVDGKHFLCWKFRTMHSDAELLLDEYLQKNPLLCAEWEQSQKLRDDPRVTRIGHFLRKTSLDELPQLWNVVLGEMSLIGPRPIVDAEVPKYGEIYSLYRRIRPGMSGLWQVSGRSDTGYAERVEMDAGYVHDWSVWLDIVLLARTVQTVIRGRGAY